MPWWGWVLLAYGGSVLIALFGILGFIFYMDKIAHEVYEELDKEGK
jgi:cell division protein FtsW (lipid II flippase)